MAFVYWIHHPNHTNMFESGYIGFTSNTVEQRFKEHLSVANSDNSRNYPIYNAIRKYGDDLVIETLLEGSDEYCLEMEYKLRPSTNIGWNISCGGGAPMLGKKHSAETLQKLREIGSDPERRRKISERAKSIPVWLHGSSDKLIWASADLIYTCYVCHGKSIGSVLLARAFNLGEKQIETMLEKFRTGWTPLQDVDWLEWSKSFGLKLESGWRENDPPLCRKHVVMTDELRQQRGIGGRNRVWTEEMKANLREKNLGRKMPKEAVEKVSAALRGKKFSEERKAEIKKRLEEMPWTNATTVRENWAKSEHIKQRLEQGATQADLLREFKYHRRSGALRKIINKLKSGWNPSQDLSYLAWLEEYKKEANNAKT